MNKIPILKLNDVLIVSIQDDLTDRDIVDLQSDILDKIYQEKIFGVLIDISVLDMLDSYLGRVISDTAKMIKLLGATTILTGMKPNVAVALIELGMQITGIKTALDLESGVNILQGLKALHIDESYIEELIGED